MAEVAIRDVVMWTKHIYGDLDLKEHLSNMSAEREVELVVDGIKGYWRKMADGKDGRPTTGLTPQGRMQTSWRELYASRRGESVSIALSRSEAGDGSPGWSSLPATARSSTGSVDRSSAAIDAARRAFLTSRGWSFEGRTVTRDELYE